MARSAQRVAYDVAETGMNAIKEEGDDEALRPGTHPIPPGNILEADRVRYDDMTEELLGAHRDAIKTLRNTPFENKAHLSHLGFQAGRTFMWNETAEKHAGPFVRTEVPGPCDFIQCSGKNNSHHIWKKKESQRFRPV